MKLLGYEITVKKINKSQIEIRNLMPFNAGREPEPSPAPPSDPKPRHTSMLELIENARRYN